MNKVTIYTKFEGSPNAADKEAIRKELRSLLQGIDPDTRWAELSGVGCWWIEFSGETKRNVFEAISRGAQRALNKPSPSKSPEGSHSEVTKDDGNGKSLSLYSQPESGASDFETMVYFVSVVRDIINNIVSHLNINTIDVRVYGGSKGARVSSNMKTGALIASVADDEETLDRPFQQVRLDD